MVHALHAVRGVLRPAGALISITPERFEARIAVVGRSHRVAAGRLINPSFDRYLLAAEAALGITSACEAPRSFPSTSICWGLHARVSPRVPGRGCAPCGAPVRPAPASRSQTAW
jgi:hypothetical protein